MNIEAKRKFIINVMFYIIFAAFFYFTIKYVLGWFTPFIIAFIVAFILEKPIELLTRKTRVPRTAWSLLLVALFYILVLSVVIFPMISAYNGIGSFLSWIQLKMPYIKAEVLEIVNSFNNLLDRFPDAVSEVLESYPTKLLESAGSLVTGFASVLAKGIITYFPNTLLTSIITVVASCFTTVYFKNIKNFLLCQFSEDRQKLIVNVKNMLTENVLKMLGGYILILFITFVELFIGMLLLGVPYAGIFAVIIAIFDILPVVGTGTILIPWFLIDIAMGKTGHGIGVLLIYIAITVIRNIIEPKIIGKRIGLFPLVTLISMYVGLKLFGIYGMLILPLTIVVLIQLQKAEIIHIWNNPKSEPKADKKGVFAGFKEKITAKKK